MFVVTVCARPGSVDSKAAKVMLIVTKINMEGVDGFGTANGCFMILPRWKVAD
jgi:hypothetical protein